jgi:uncharacterized membrane protein YecN with MAPEG domain
MKTDRIEWGNGTWYSNDVVPCPVPAFLFLEHPQLQEGKMLACFVSLAISPVAARVAYHIWTRLNSYLTQKALAFALKLCFLQVTGLACIILMPT